MRTGCLPHRCVMMVVALLPLIPPDSSSALQPHISSARRAMFLADKEKDLNDNMQTNYTINSKLLVIFTE